MFGRIVELEYIDIQNVIGGSFVEECLQSCEYCSMLCDKVCSAELEFNDLKKAVELTDGKYNKQKVGAIMESLENSLRKIHEFARLSTSNQLC